MKKNKNIVIYIIVFFVIILLAYLLFKDRISNKEIVFNIKNNNLEVQIGSNIKIDYELSEDLPIVWESENKDIVTVNNGFITGVGLGNTLVKGTIKNGDKTITQNCFVTSYYGNKTISLNDVVIPNGELFISKGDSYNLDLKYDPSDAYIYSIDYSVSDPNIVEFNGTVLAKEIGTTDITITINKSISKTITVNVVDKKTDPVISNKIKEINVDSEIITLKPGDTSKINYTIEPTDAFIENVDWESSNENVVTVMDGELTAKSAGESVITLTINDISKEIKVLVEIPITGLSLSSNPKLVMKVGEKDTIKTTITPSNATNQKLKYANSNLSSLNVDDNGNITAVGQGNGTITISTMDNKHQVTINYRVNPKNGVVNNSADVWGYTSPIDKAPERADANFFKNMASKGKGILSGNIYTYNNGKKTYTYDLSKSSLSDGSKSVLMRMYYPKDVDLSTVNTFTFCNGTGSGAKGFVGILRALDDDHSKMKTSGIIILIASKDGKGYNQNEIMLATEFVKSLVNQKSGVKNAVGAYSGSGEAVGYAGHNGGYDRVVIFNSYFKPYYNLNLKNKEIIVYSPNNDKLQGATKDTIGSMIRNGYTNVTIISNNSTIINNTNYSSNYLIINPGSQMGAGHGYVNIPPTNVFSYACR